MWNTLIIEPMVNALLWIYGLVGNFGVAIILFTILIRLITHPLTAQQVKSTQVMGEMQKSKKWQEMQKKYKDDKEKLAKEQMAMYKEFGINPLGSCLPMVIQFPIIIGLYQAVTRAMAASPFQLLDLSKLIYPFVHGSELIPLNSQFLWMNLGQPERLNIFGIGIPVLTILVVITTFLQSKLMTPPPANPGDQAAQMSKMMNLYMPILMGYFAFTLASGLALYFVIGNLVGIAQYALLGKINWRNLLPKKKATSA
jgi:YidC/Oxa1 family membrane protein insertase